RVSDDGSARGQQHVRLARRDLAQASDEFTRPGRVSVISARLRLRNGILQAGEIEQLAIAVDQIACAGDALPTELKPVRYGSARVTRRSDDFHSNALEIQHLAFVHRSRDSHRLPKDLRVHLGIIVEPPGFVRSPELGGTFEQRSLSLRYYRRRATR